MIEKVEVIPGCISCRTCETVCPSIFHVSPKSKVISHNYEGKESEILQAEIMCPVNVIKVQKKGGITLNFQHATLSKTKYLTNNIIELTFEANNFHCKPGQYISLLMNDKWGEFSRSYSIAEHTNHSFILNIKLEKYGRGSNYLKNLANGNKITYLGPLGNFYLKNEDDTGRKIFIATGTGLAPLYNMIIHLPKETPKLLIFGNRFEGDIYYMNKLLLVENLEIVLKVSRPHKDHLESKGRVTDELKKIEKGEEVYLCGNPHMITEVKNHLIDAGHEKEKLFSEAFTESHVHTGSWKDIIYNGSIPFKKELSWIIILFSLILIPTSWFYMRSQNDLFGSFFITDNFMGLLYDISWFSVVLVMAIRPLKDIFPKIGILRTLCYYRKALGILSATIIVTNWLGGYYFNPAGLERYFLAARWDIGLPLAARLSELTALVLLLTSNDISQKLLGSWWKRIQRSSYIYFITGGIMAAQLFPWKVYPLMMTVIFLYIIAEIILYIRKNKAKARS
ncbi:ferredoxin [Candidatus Gracilibacteria bacterium]|nr:ferredoxin [Candidatus Gracilibacteria bacterium]